VYLEQTDPRTVIVFVVVWFQECDSPLEFFGIAPMVGFSKADHGLMQDQAGDKLLIQEFIRNGVSSVRLFTFRQGHMEG